MSAMPSIKVVKETPYEGGMRRWSNRYHFSGGTPADSAHWTTLSDNVVADEADALHTYSTIVETIGYAAGSDVPVFSKSYSTSGNYALTGSNIVTPLQTAMVLRYSTDARTTKNHPIYLFTYWHDVVLDATVTHESPAGSHSTALLEYGNDWVAGFSDGVNTYHRAGPNGAVALGAFVDEYVSHRDFPT
jgi:hypothetical protein